MTETFLAQFARYGSFLLGESAYYFGKTPTGYVEVLILSFSSFCHGPLVRAVGYRLAGTSSVKPFRERPTVVKQYTNRDSNNE